MRTHNHPTSSASRSSAEDGHKRNGASLPAAQLYQVLPLNFVPHRISNNTDMAVRDSGNPNYFFAKGNAAIAPNNVLTPSGTQFGMTKYRSAIDYDNDCGAYASAILKEMYQVNYDTHAAYKRTKNATQNIEVPSFSYEATLFAKNLSGPARPDLGEVYLGINDPADLVQNPTHYNFHWAAVVAQDGGDVITAEAAPNAPHEWFQMYNHYTGNQTFNHQYVVTLGMLSNAAKIFTLTYHQRLKQSVDGGVIEDD